MANQSVKFYNEFHGDVLSGMRKTFAPHYSCQVQIWPKLNALVQQQHTQHFANNHQPTDSGTLCCMCQMNMR